MRYSSMDIYLIVMCGICLVVGALVAYAIWFAVEYKCVKYAEHETLVLIPIVSCSGNVCVTHFIQTWQRECLKVEKR